MDKAAVLAMVAQLEQEAETQPQQVLAIAHEENVSQWIEAIAQSLKAVPNDRVPFAELCQSLGMTRVEVWLGVMLGGFELEPDEEFYSDGFWVKGASVGLGR